MGRIFRKLGLPAWTFIGVGISAIWFNYFGTLTEKAFRDLLKLNEQTHGWRTYLPPLIVFLLPFVAVIVAFFWQRTKYPLTKLRLISGRLPQPTGKKGLILLVSRPESAVYAIEYHFSKHEKLEKVWLIPSNDTQRGTFGKSTRDCADIIKQKCQLMADEHGRTLAVEIHATGVSPADSQDTFDYVNRIFRQSDYEPGELVADFTGGTKPMSVGMVMACLPTQRELEYVSYNPETGQSHGPFLIDYQHRAFDLVG